MIAHWFQTVALRVGLRGRLSTGSRRSRREQAALLAKSPMLEPDWYRSRYPDVAAAGLDPASHYLEHGWREGRDPGPSFSTAAYLEENPDVARAGINPLLHFLEYGYSEGRGASQQGPSPLDLPPAATEPIGAAAPCVSLPVKDFEPVRWQRAFQLRSSDGHLFSVGETAIGYVRNAELRRLLEAKFACLAWLSGGCQDRSTPLSSEGERHDAGALLDGWYINHDCIRLRWAGSSSPMILRAYQADSASSGPALVGEGLTTSTLDFIDCNLLNPFFPVLLILADADGAVLGWEFIGFPSLFRGGLHYPELIYLCRRLHPDEPHAMAMNSVFRALTQRLVDARSAAKSSKSTIAVDRGGAGGAEPLYQGDLQAWLGQVMRVSVRMSDARITGPNQDYLSGAIAVEAAEDADDGVTLRLASNMVPTITALTALGGDSEGSASNGTIMPLLIAGLERTQPITFLDVPASNVSALRLAAEDYAALWPKLRGCEGSGATYPVAIRISSTQLPTGPELLVPVMAPALPIAPRPPVTWLIEIRQGADEITAATLNSINLQLDSQSDQLLLVGRNEATIDMLARRLFGDRASWAADIDAAASAIASPFTALVGYGVVLHDARCSAFLCSILEEPEVMTASCLMIAAHQQGKSWQVSIADGGSVEAPNGSSEAIDFRLLWRGAYPPRRPPRDFWIARSGTMIRWTGADEKNGAAAGLHVCTSLITASYYQGPETGEPLLSPPAAASALKAEVLFG